MNKTIDIIDNLPEEESVVTSHYSNEKIAHYNDNSVFIKGLIGMILCIAPVAIIGLILIKLSLDDAKKARTDFKENPERYLDSSIKKVNAGRTMAYIGLFLFIAEIVAIVAIMSMH